jgi:DNA-binding NarL/FixJ family response regulator
MLISEVARSPELRDRLAEVLVEANDRELAARHALTHRIVSMRDPASVLTRRERDVFDLLTSGLTNREIAQRLFISEATAKVHVRHILRKLGARTRTEAALMPRAHDAQRASGGI